MSTAALKKREAAVEDPEGMMREYKRTNDPRLRNQLVLHYAFYINIAIFKMRSVLLSSVPFEDFYNEGILALISCIEKYDPDRGVKFDTYIYKGVRGALLNYMRKQNWMPNRVWSMRKKIAAANRELEQALMREPSEAELARQLGLSPDKLAQYELEIASSDSCSFEELLDETGGVLSRAESLRGEEIGEGLLEQELRDVLAQAIDALPAKQKQVISLCYYENLNLREIGEVMGITQQRVSQVRSSALEKLGKVLREYENGGA